MEENFLEEYGLSSKHPLLSQPKLLTLYENLVELCIKNNFPALKDEWNQFQQFFKVKQITEVINKSQSGKILLFVCPEHLLSLISSVKEKKNVPIDILSNILSKLLNPSSCSLMIYQGKVESSDIVLTKVLSTMEGEICSKNTIVFPRHLLLDYSLSVLTITENDFQQFAKGFVNNQGLSFHQSDVLPNDFIPANSKLWKTCEFLTGSNYSNHPSEGELLAQEHFIDYLYDDSWASYLSTLIHLTKENSSIYVNCFLKVAINSMKLPALRARGIVDNLAEILISQDFLFPLLRRFLLSEKPTVQFREVFVSCLECMCKISQLCERYSKYLINKDFATFVTETIGNAMESSFCDDISISKIIHCLRCVVLHNKGQQKAFTEAGVINCLDDCLVKYTSVILKDVISFAQAIELKPNKYINLPDWLRTPFKESNNGQSLETLIADLESSDETSKTLGTALKRSLLYGLSSLMPERIEPKEMKVSEPIINDVVYSLSTWASAKEGDYGHLNSGNSYTSEFISSCKSLIETNQQFRFFAQAVDVEETSWLKGWYLFLAEHAPQVVGGSRFDIDRIVPFYQVNTGLPLKVSDRRWTFYSNTVDCFGFFEPLEDQFYEQEDLTSLICRDRCQYLKTSVDTVSVWSFYDPSEWHVIRDDIYKESEHNRPSPLNNHSVKKNAKMEKEGYFSRFRDPLGKGNTSTVESSGKQSVEYHRRSLPLSSSYSRRFRNQEFFNRMHYEGNRIMERRHRQRELQEKDGQGSVAESSMR
jgi:hypothetical protein